MTVGEAVKVLIDDLRRQAAEKKLDLFVPNISKYTVTFEDDWLQGSRIVIRVEGMRLSE